MPALAQAEPGEHATELVGAVLGRQQLEGAKGAPPRIAGEPDEH